MNRQLESLLPNAARVAAILPLALLCCSIGKGTHQWTIKGHAKFTYPGPLPVPSGNVTLTMNVMRDGHPMPPGDRTWSGSFANGELDIPAHRVDLGFDGDFYEDKAVWVLTTINGGMYYADTAYFYPLLKIEDPAERTWTMEFVIHEQPPD